MFRTGDLVRLLSGDQFEFFGRLDHQVKLRGFRIELGEIEFALRSFPAVDDAVAALTKEASVNRILLPMSPLPSLNWISKSCATTSLNCCRSTWCLPALC